MSIATKIGKASSYFFFFGFVTGKLKYFPAAFVSSILNLTSILFYLTGYSIWFIACHFFPDAPPLSKEWYEFAQFKEQYIYAATLGITASIICIFAITAPMLLIPAAWLFFCSNIIWAVGEYNKLHNPPDNDDSYSHGYQQNYSTYAIIMSVITFIASTGTTLSLIFPPFCIPILTVSVLVCMGLGIVAGQYWFEANFGDHEKTTTSHQQMNPSLGNTLKPQITHSPEPVHTKRLFSTLSDTPNARIKPTIEAEKPGFTLKT